MGMQGLTSSQISDLLDTTRPKQPKDRYSNTLPYTNFNAAKLLFKQAREDIGGGATYEARVQLRYGTAARWTQPYAVTPNVLDELVAYSSTARAWFESHFMFDKREKAMNEPSDERIVKNLNARQDGAVIGLWKMIEESICRGTQPTVGAAANFLALFTLLSTCTTGTTDAVGGFNGTTYYKDDGTSSTTICGIDASTVANANWKNWCATYSGNVDKNLVDSIRRARGRTNFEKLPELKGDPFRSGGMVAGLCGHTVSEGLVAMANVGSDVRRVEGSKGDPAPLTEVEVCGLPLIKVAALENVSFQPFVGVNTQHLYGMTLSEGWMAQGDPLNHQQSSNTFRVPIDGTCLATVDNRREAGFVIHTVRS